MLPGHSVLYLPLSLCVTSDFTFTPFLAREVAGGHMLGVP